jgi:hypothetical protein
MSAPELIVVVPFEGRPSIRTTSTSDSDDGRLLLSLHARPRLYAALLVLLVELGHLTAADFGDQDDQP